MRLAQEAHPVKRTIAAILIPVGVVGMVMAYSDYSSKFDNESIWARQKTLLEHYVKEVPARKQKLDELRSGIKNQESSSRKEKCAFELEFETVVRHNGDKLAAKDEREMKSYEPNVECNTSVQLKESVYNYNAIGGALAFIVGTIFLIKSFAGRKDAP